MTESVTPPDPPLVDPETGETPPLSPPRTVDQALHASMCITTEQFLDVAKLSRLGEPFIATAAQGAKRALDASPEWQKRISDAIAAHPLPEALRKRWLWGEWDEYERDISAHVESDDAA